MLLEPRDGFRVLQHRQQLCHGFALSRQDQIRRDFAQRLKHKTAQMRARMRQSQVRRISCFRAERNQIQIQRPRLVQNLFRRAAKFLFQRAEFLEQRFRRFIFLRREASDGVHIQRRVGWTIHRRGLPQRRFEQRPAGKFLEPRHRLQNDSPRITEIGAQCDVGQASCLSLTCRLHCLEMETGWKPVLL